ncbi:MAG: D-alanyl-D-alanine carboxypeptidase, partial [Cellvibrionaceae bacterium]|nr:D-alanyl-D-alanine carboxypeptidase [Cellvibrionaceae bacterium]
MNNKAAMAFCCYLLCCLPLWAQAKSLNSFLNDIEAMPKASLLAAANRANNGIDIRSNKPLIPASTMKLVTAYLALERWGEAHRFSTEFYRQGDTLWVKGLGDPGLTSEELELISLALSKRLRLDEIKRIKLDNSYFPDLRLDGRGRSDNPYDAANAALAVNYNTVHLKRDRRGLRSGEDQTPMTPMARKLGRNVKGSYRMCLPGGRVNAARYFGQVFSQILFNRQLPQQIAQVPADAKLIYTHRNSRNLAKIVETMLEYSNNFISNQLFLLMGAQGGAVTEEKAIAVAEASLKQKFGWRNFKIYDGAGLSRRNRLSTQQLLELVQAMRPWLWLLPAPEGH